MTVDLDIQRFIWPNQYLLTIVGLWPMDSDVSAFHRFFPNIQIALLIVALFFYFIPQFCKIIIFWGDIVIMSGEFATAY